MKIGQVCVKIAGREANKKCIIVDILNDSFVLIDGNVKRKKCNIKHLEPLDEVLKISKNASTSKVHEAMKKAKIEIIPKKQKKVKVAKEPEKVKVKKKIRVKKQADKK